MAVKNNDLTYALDIQTDESKKNLDALIKSIQQATAETEALDKSSEQLNSEVRTSSKTHEAYSKALTSTTGNMKSIDSTFKNLDQSVGQFNSQLKETSKAFDTLSLPTDGINGLAAAFTALSASVSALAAVASTLADLAIFIEKLGNPAVAKQIDDVLVILQALASVKGFDTVAAGLELLRTKTTQLSEQIRRLDNMNALSAKIFVEDNALRARAFLALEKVFDTVFKAITAGLIAVFGVQLYFAFSKAVSAVQNATGIMGKVLAGATASWTAFGEALKGTFNTMKLIAEDIRTFFSKSMQLMRDNSELAISALLALHPGLKGVADLLEAFGYTSTDVAAKAVKLVSSISSLGTVITNFVLSSLTDLVIAFGTKLVDAMDAFTNTAAKAEQAASQFGFTVASFGKTYGESAIGTMQQWNDLIETLGKTSFSSTAEIEKSAKLLISDGQAIGMTFDKMAKLLARASELSANSGIDLYEVTQRLLQGIAGNAQAVLSLGINLHSNILEHSILNKTMMKTIDTMSSMEQKQTRLFEIFHQTEPIVGATAVQMETLIGITQRLEKSFYNIKSMIGSNNSVILKLRSTYADFIQNLEELPPIIYYTIGAVADFGGIIIVGIGYIIKYGLALSGLVAAFNLLNNAVNTSVFVQGVLTATFKTLAAFFSVQAVAVTSMATVWQNFIILLKADIMFGLAALGKSLQLVATRIYSLSVAILTNPLFIKATLIAAAIYAVIQAFKELDKQFGIFTNSVGGSSDAMNLFTSMFTRLKTAVTAIMRILIEFFKVVLVGLTSIGVAAARVGATFAKAFQSQEDVEAWNLYIEELDNKLGTLDKAAEQSRTNVAAAFQGITGNTEAMAAAFEAAGAGIDDFKLRTDALKTTADTVDTASIRIEVLGTEVEKLQNSYAVAGAAARKASAEFIKGAEDSQKVLDDYKKAVEDQQKAMFGLEKARIDNLKELSKRTEDLRLDELKAMTNQTQAINAEYDKRVVELNTYISELRKLGPMIEADAKVISSAFAQLEKARKGSLRQENEKHIKESLEEENKLIKEQYERLSQVLSKNREIAIQIASVNATALEKINSELAISLEYLDDQILLEKARVITDTLVVDALQKQRDLLIQNAALQRDMAKMEFTDWIKDLGKAIQDAFGKKAIDGWFNYLGDKFEEVRNTPLIVNIEERVRRTIAAVQETSKESGVTGAVESVGKVVSKAANVLYQAGGTILSGLVKVGGWVGAVIDVFMNADKYLRVLLDFPKMFLKIITALPGLVKQFIDLFPQGIRAIAEALPTILVQLVDMIPDFIQAFVDSMPTLIERIAEAIPIIFVKLVAMLPKLVELLFKAVGKAVQSLVKGLIRGLGRLFSGKLPKVEINTDGLKKQMKKLQGSSERLFNVADLAEAVKDPLDKMMENIREGFASGANLISKAWKWVMDHIITPLSEAITKAWHWVLDNVITPIAGLLKTAWMWVYDTVLKPIRNLVQGAFQWAYDHVIAPIWTTITGAFLWVDEKILKPIGDAVRSAFSWVFDNIVQPLASVGEKIAKPVVDAFAGIMSIFNSIGEVLKNLFKLDFSGVKEALQDIFSKGGELLTNALKGFMNPLFKVFNAVIDVLNGLVLPGLSWKISAGKLGSWSGRLWDDIDLLPGDISKIPMMASGGLVDSMNALPIPGPDNIPRLLERGEFVVNRPAVQSVGTDFLENLNRGRAPGGGNQEISINMGGVTINIHTNKVDETFISRELTPRLIENIRRASLDGRFVLSAKGIR